MRCWPPSEGAPTSQTSRRLDARLRVRLADSTCVDERPRSGARRRAVAVLGPGCVHVHLIIGRTQARPLLHLDSFSPENVPRLV